MVKRTVADLKPYNAPGHFNMVAMRIHGKEETGAEKFWIGVSTFLPGGGAEWAYEDNPLEKVYYILEGEMTVTDKDGKKYVLHKDESISFPPNEGRGLKNESGKPAKMPENPLMGRKSFSPIRSKFFSGDFPRPRVHLR